VDYEGVTVHSCDGCGGEFLGPGELAHVVQTRETRFDGAIFEQIAGQEPIFGIPSKQTAREMQCPDCRESMVVVNYAGDTGICVDRCRCCGGVWLDHEELEKVQALTERWSDEAPDQLQAVAGELEAARKKVAASSANAFQGSRFAFVNAMINRILD
jgi:Zn-finger nucleic acid-binding protein